MTRSATDSRGSNPLACRTVFLGYKILQAAEVQTLWLVGQGLFGYCFSGSAQVQTLWVYDQFGSLSMWVQILWLEWTCFEGFLLRAQA